jgi:hypothetical protein
MYIEMPFSDCISRLICIYRDGISLPHNFLENYATCPVNLMSKSIKMHLPLSWLARFVSANIPFLKRSTFFTNIFLWNKKSDELYIVSTGGTTLHKWSGIGDGRYLNEEIVHLIKTDERFNVVKDNVQSTNTLNLVNNNWF